VCIAYDTGGDEAAHWIVLFTSHYDFGRNFAEFACYHHRDAFFENGERL
jgi:hypothetical protein